MTTETQAPEGALRTAAQQALDAYARHEDNKSAGRGASTGPELLVAMAALRAALAAQAQDDWRQYATERETTAQQVIERHRREIQSALRQWQAALAAQPQAAREYREANPLGGPAKVFRAMADAIEAGDSYEDTLRRFEYAEAKPSPAEGDAPVAFEAREIGEGDWFRVGLDETERIKAYIASPSMDYRWLYAQPQTKGTAEPTREFLIGALLGLPPGDVFAGAFKSDAQSVAANLLQACREDSMSDRTRILIGQALHFVLAAKERA